MAYQKKVKPKYLYSIWRNRDDRLIILDGTVEQCCAAMHIKLSTFRFITSRHCKTYTVRKITEQELASEVDE